MNIKIFPVNPLQENTYLIWDDEKNTAIIDPGMVTDREKERVKRFIDENDLKLKRLLNTHLHFDHQFGNQFICEHYNITPEAGREDEFLMETVKESARFFGLEFEGTPPEIGNYIIHNQHIKIGNISLLALHTPGHSPGSYSFYNKEANAVFVGDVLFNGSIGRTDLPRGDFNTLIHSIKTQLFTLPPKTIVYPGHATATTIEQEIAMNPYF
ncbi:MAG: MBL fold hydrolase [Paludibacter sp.]|nr:MAG: MBL fold hydrolase [Paludibacter sp.]